MTPRQQSLPDDLIDYRLGLLHCPRVAPSTLWPRFATLISCWARSRVSGIYSRAPSAQGMGESWPTVIDQRTKYGVGKGLVAAARVTRAVTNHV